MDSFHDDKTLRKQERCAHGKVTYLSEGIFICLICERMFDEDDCVTANCDLDGNDIGF